MTYVLQFNQSKEFHFQLNMSNFQLEMIKRNSKSEVIRIFNNFNQ